MSIFCYKPIEPSVSLGKLFKQTREEKKLILEQLADQTHLGAKYLQALEEEKFSDLPRAKAYRLAYVKSYAKALGLKPEKCLRQFYHEGGLEDVTRTHPQKQIKRYLITSVSTFVQNAGIALGVALFAGYLIWQVKGILEPPKLTIFFPAEGYVSLEPTTVIQGETEQESRLAVNGQEVMVNNRGSFEAKIDLINGINTIAISATKKHGKTTTVIRHIIVKQNQTDRFSLK